MLDNNYVYYWAWQEKDNVDYDFNKPKWFRVFRAIPNHVHDPVVTEPMTRDEAIAFCERIVKLTGGSEL
jgi:hypothetical protein